MTESKETSATTPQQVAKSASAKKMLMGDLMQTVGILPILILIVAVFGFIAPNFFTESNLLNITRQASINIVLAAGMTFIILTGGIDLSVGSILGTTAVAAMVVSLMPELSMLSVPAALMLGMALGLFNGALVAFAGLPPFIVTLGTYTALRGAAYLLADGTTVIAVAGGDCAGGHCHLLVHSASHHARRSYLRGGRQHAGGPPHRDQSVAGAALCVWHERPAFRPRRRDERLPSLQCQR